MRYIRAFFAALKMTLQGEKVTSPAQRQFPRLFKWLHTAEEHLNTALERAEQSGFDKTKRQAISVRVDGRDTDMETILTTLRFHITEEYPYLLENLTEHSVTALYASNLNDRYWVMSLAECDELDNTVRKAIAKLSAHLDNIPPSNEVGQST